MAKQLPLVVNGVGDCVEVDIQPEDVRNRAPEKFIIRQVAIDKWRIWRKK